MPSKYKPHPKPLKRATPTRSREAGDRTAAARETRRLVHKRAGGACEGCAAYFSTGAWSPSDRRSMEMSHRQNGSPRLWSPDLVMALCADCHRFNDHASVHRAPAWARSVGWNVPRGIAEPGMVRVWYRRERWVRLTPQGGIERLRVDLAPIRYSDPLPTGEGSES